MSRKLKNVSREVLHDLYWVQKKSAREIGEQFSCSAVTVTRWFKKIRIPLREREEWCRLMTESRRKRAIKTKLKSELLCRKCGATWKHETAEVWTTCPYCGAKKDARDRSGWWARTAQAKRRKAGLEEWCSDAENRRKRDAKCRRLLRKRVFFRITGSIHHKCVRCGCDDSRLLEVNHKNGGGGKEMQKGKFSSRFYWEIAKGKRATDDLEILCKPCNAIHYLEMKYGPLPIKVAWSGHSTPPPT